MKYGVFYQSSNTSFYGISDTVHYSCDMVRLRFKFISDDDMQEFVKWLNRIYIYGFMDDSTVSTITVKHTYKNADFCYRDFFSISSVKMLHSSIKMGIGFYGLTNSTSEDGRLGFIEFNPNKVDYALLYEIFKMLRLRCRIHSESHKKFELVRWDLAIDVPIDRCYLSLLKDNRDYAVYDTQKGYTQTLGHRGNSGYVKLYDKKKEAKLESDLTRLEVTFEDFEPHILPDVVLEQRQQELAFDLNNTQAVLVELLNNLPYQERTAYMKRLGRTVREKLQPYVVGQNKLEYDYSAINHIYAMLKDLEQGIFPEFEMMPFEDIK